jgi:hypothetical protein
LQDPNTNAPNTNQVALVIERAPPERQFAGDITRTAADLPLGSDRMKS